LVWNFTGSQNDKINPGKEVLMIEVTAAATQQVAEFFKGRDVKPIRIFLNSGG
jgi:hypothetical protein